MEGNLGLDDDQVSVKAPLSITGVGQIDAPAVNNRGNVVKKLEEEVNTWLEGNLAQLRANQGYDCAIQPSRSVRTPEAVKASFLAASDGVPVRKNVEGRMRGSVQPRVAADEDALLQLSSCTSSDPIRHYRTITVSALVRRGGLREDNR